MENPKPPDDRSNMTEDNNTIQQQQQSSSDLKYLESISQEAKASYDGAIFELHFLKAEGDYLQLDNFQARPSDKAIDVLDKLPVTEESNDKIVELLASDEEKVQKEKTNTRQKSLEQSAGEKPIGRLTRAQSKEESEKQNATPPPQHKTVSRGQAARDAMSLKRTDTSQRLRNGSSSVSSVEKVLMTKNFTESQRNAYVERAVNQLKSQGLWSGDRLPKLVDPRQAKTNWDYVMDEMQWLATDFAQERKWKVAAARKIARAVRQYHRAKEEKKKKEEREAYLKKRRLAAKIARGVHAFWDGINRVVQYKHESLMEEKRQKILDIQLNFIVGQTERYSGYLTKQLQANNDKESKNADAPATTTEKEGDKESSEVPPTPSSTQGEAPPKEDESAEKEKVAEVGEKDVEAKAEKEEKESKESSNVADEDAAQQIPVRRSSRKRNAASTDSSSAINTAADEKPSKIAKMEESGPSGNDEEFDPEAEGNVSDDDEATMQQEEDQQDEKEDHKEEIKELEEDNDLSIEELMKKYGYEVPSEDTSAAADENAPPADETSSSKSEQAGGQDEKDEGKKEEDEGDDEALKFLVDDNDEDEEADKNKENEEAASEGGGDFDEASKQARNIQPTGHTLATTQVKTPIPKLLRGELREYQHIGLNWLVTLYNERLNGILADEMGLGKTIQTIALLAYLACEKGVWGPHLIVVPTSVMLNWEMEFKKWCPGFKILTYYGNQKERKMKRTGWSKSNAFHVCITSYKLVVQDHAAFRRRKWRYLILDEAHNIKNFKSQRWQALLNFNSQRRLLLTGTPLQNNLMELWSLMHFLMPHLFQSRNDFKDWFANPLDGMVGGEAEYNEGIIRRLHKVLRPFLLRRVKKEVEKQMPNKYEHVVRCHLSKRQRFLYEDFMSRAATKDTLAKGDLLSVMNVLMQLRKVCNHPNLFEPRPIVTSFTTRALEYQPPALVASCLVERDPLAQAVNLTDLNLHLPALCGFTTHQVDSIRELRADDRQLIELSPPQSPAQPRTNKISTSMRKTIMDKLAKKSMASYHERVEEVKKSLSARINKQLNSRSQQSPSQLSDVASVASLERIKGNKRLDAESYSKWLGRMQQARKAENRVRTARINETRCDVSNQVVSSNLIKLLQSIYLCKREDDYVNNGYAELATVVINKLYKEMIEMQTLDKVDIVIPRVESPSMLYHQQHPPQWETYQLKNKKQFLVDYFKPCKLMMSKKLLFPETQLIQYDCGKLQILNVLLRRFQEGKHRVLIFTQMTKVLDILEVFLNYHGYRYLRLDGSTHIEERMIRMERFNNDKRIFCFILSTRSGGIGVNLTGADTVVFYDSDWNPTMDAQAQDRCHRIGQTRDVHIYRLISERTIEENILRKANQKRMLNNLAIEGGHFTTSFFTKQGIKDIFAEPSGLENMDEDQQKLEQKLKDKQNQQKRPGEDSSPPSAADAAADSKKDEKEFGEALLRSEDMEDQCAAEMVEKEQIAEREEFGDNPNTNSSNQEGVTRAEEKIRAVYEQLSSLQRYAVDYIERNANISFDDQLQMAQEDLEKAKKTWEVNHLLSLKEEEERRLEEEEDDIFYVCEEGVNQHFYEVHTGEEMPTWYPPTPPKDDEDYYVDDTAMFLYKSTPMNVSDLPPVIPLQNKNSETLIPVRRIMRGDVAFAGCLFKHSHAPPATRGRNKDKPGKQVRGSQAAAAASSNASATKNSKNNQQSSVHLISAIRNEQGGGKEGVDYMKTDRNNEWSINEDYTIAHHVERMLETSGMTPQASAQLPARLIDWGIVAGVVHTTSNRYRSADECERRYNHIQMMREEKANQAGNAYGMNDSKSIMLAPPNLPPPKKKQKTLQKLMGQKNKTVMAPPSGSNDSSGTKRMFADDGNKQYTTNLVHWLGACNLAVEKRAKTQSQTQDQLNIIALTSTSAGSSVSNSVVSSSKLTQQFSLNSKQLSMLQDLGVDYDKPTTPMQFSIGAHRTSNKQQRQQQTKRTSDQPSTSQVINGPAHHGHQQISSFVMTSNPSPHIAIPITGSGGAAGVVVPQGFARRLVSHQGGKSATTTVAGHGQHKVQQAKQAVSALTFRTMGNSISQLQLQQQQQVGSSQQQQPIAVSFSQQQQVVTITSTVTNAQQQRGNVYTARGNLQKITGSLQQVRQQKALQHQQALQQVKQQQVKVKQVRVSQAGVHQIQGGNVIQATHQAKAVMGGKAVQIGKPQQPNRYELYMKSNAGNRANTQFKPFTHQRAQQKPMTQKSSVKIKGGGEAQSVGGAARRTSKSGEKVQIAPLQGQQQAQVRSLVAHQSGGNQPQGGGKPILVASHTLPSTSLPVTAVTLNVSSVSQQKPMIVANNQNYVIQQPYFKQRQQSTQQQARQVIAAKQGKAVYATAQQLIAATGGRAGTSEQQVKAIQHGSAGTAQVIHAQLTTGAQQQRIVQQQQQAQQRRTAMSSQQQQLKNMAPHTVTVTKLMTATTTGAVLSQVTYPTGAPAGSITFPASGKTYQVQQNPVTSRTTINTPKTYQIQPQQLSGRSSQQQQIQISTNQLNQAQQLINVSAPIQQQQDQTERDNN